MTISFTCPHCGTQTDVFDEFAGQSGPCVVCGKLITVPYPSGPYADSPSSASAPPRAPRRWMLRWLVAAAVLLAVTLGAGIFVFVLFTLVFPVMSAGRQAALKSGSASHLKAIVTALQSYEADYGCLPPAFVADESGKPMHSWRVLLLPYLGYDHVYRRYDFTQPWDSANNMQVASMMPAEYASPADPDAKPRFESSYVVIVGQGTPFPGRGTKQLADISDELSQTILVAETPTFGHCWLEPVDLRADQMRFVINGREGVEIGSRFVGGAHVGLADGSVRFLQDETPPEYVQAMVTIAGNEPLPWFETP